MSDNFNNIVPFLDGLNKHLIEAHEQMMNQLEKIYLHLLKQQEQGGAFFETKVLTAGGQPYEVNYWGKKHLFAYCASAVALDSSDFGSIALTANSWTNIGFPETTRLSLHTGGPTPIIFKATDEVAA